MNEQKLIEDTVQYVKQELKGAEAGHDWWHVERVWRNTNTLLKYENANPLICQLAALLHDIADSKFHNGDEEIGPATARHFLIGQKVCENIVSEVISIIKNMSYSTALGEVNYHSSELSIVQDADRLDAMGAIGIARAFNYGGFKNREIYNPKIPIVENRDKEGYKNNRAPTIHHFYDKLLKLKDKMNTETGKKMAQKRHEFLVQYLDQFFNEWEGLG